jgi:hypothetical protein
MGERSPARSGSLRFAPLVSEMPCRKRAVELVGGGDAQGIVSGGPVCSGVDGPLTPPILIPASGPAPGAGTSRRLKASLGSGWSARIRLFVGGEDPGAYRPVRTDHGPNPGIAEESSRTRENPWKIISRREMTRCPSPMAEVSRLFQPVGGADIRPGLVSFRTYLINARFDRSRPGAKLMKESGTVRRLDGHRSSEFRWAVCRDVVLTTPRESAHLTAVGTRSPIRVTTPGSPVVTPLPCRTSEGWNDQRSRSWKGGDPKASDKPGDNASRQC